MKIAAVETVLKSIETVYFYLFENCYLSVTGERNRFRNGSKTMRPPAETVFARVTSVFKTTIQREIFVTSYRPVSNSLGHLSKKPLL